MNSFGECNTKKEIIEKILEGGSNLEASVNIVFVYPSTRQTDVMELNNEDYLSVIEKLNTAGCKYTQRYLDEKKIYYIYLEEEANNDVMNILDYTFLMKNNIDSDDYCYEDDNNDNDDEEMDDPLFDPDEQDGHNCLEGGTGQWAHN